MNLIQKLKDNSEAARKRDWRRYAELLRADSPDPKSIAEIEAIILRLGRTLDQVLEDAQAMRTALMHVQNIEHGHGVGAKVEAATREVQQNHERMQGIISQMQSEHRQLAAKANDLGNIQASSREAVGYLEKLKGSNPELLADIPQFHRDSFEQVQS